MSFHLSIQSAPILRGFISAVSAWGTSGPDVTATGPYKGDQDATITFTVETAGTIGTTSTIEVSWASSPDIGSGRLHLGTSHGYTAGERVEVIGGVGVAFAAGAFTGSDTFTMTLEARRSVHPSHHLVTGSSEVSDVQLSIASRLSLDAKTLAHTGQIERVAVTNQINPTLTIDHMLDNERRELEAMDGLRQEVMVAENYGDDTVFLMRGGAYPIMPTIGRPPTFTRAATGTEQDPRSGLLKIAASGRLRTFPGFELESADVAVTINDRQDIPLEYDHVGRSFGLSQAVTNLLPYSQSENDQGTFTSRWTTVGTATTRWYDGDYGILDPDSDWPEKYKYGCEEVLLPGGVSDAVYSSSATVTPGSVYTGSIYLKGRGVCTAALRTGASSPALTDYATSLVTLQPDRWKRVILPGTAGVTAGHVVAEIRLRVVSGTTPPAYILMGGAQIEAGYAATDYILSDGSAASSTAEAFTLQDETPRSGTLFMAYKHPGDDATTAMEIIRTASGGDFILRRLTATERWQWMTDGSGTGAALETSSNVPSPIGLQAGAWSTVALTWYFEVDANFDKLRRTIYVNGVSAATDLTTAYDLDWGKLVFCPTNPGGLLDPAGIRFQEIRIDRSARTATEIADMHARLSEDAWLHLHRLFGGRTYDISELSQAWRAPSAPHHMISQVGLIQSRTIPDGLVTER